MVIGGVAGGVDPHQAPERRTCSAGVSWSRSPSVSPPVSRSSARAASSPSSSFAMSRMLAPPWSLESRYNASLDQASGIADERRALLSGEPDDALACRRVPLPARTAAVARLMASPCFHVPRSRRMPRVVLPRADGQTVAAIFAGGALGTLARAALAEGFPHAATSWPWPTFGVNVAAAFLLGYFVTRLQERLPQSAYRRPLLGTGICGGLSNFSPLEVEILKMISAGAWGLAAGYAAASIAAGYAAIHLATGLVRRARVRR